MVGCEDGRMGPAATLLEERRRAVRAGREWTPVGRASHFLFLACKFKKTGAGLNTDRKG